METKESKVTEFLSKYALFGIIFFLIVAIIPSLIESIKEPWKGILVNLGTSVFILLTVSYFVNEKIKYYTNNELENIISEKFPLLIDLEKIGLKKLTYDNKLKNHGINIVESDELFIVMNDGNHFLTNNAEELSQRLQRKGKKTVIILMDGESSAEKQLCERNKKETGHYKSKIEGTIKHYETYLKNGSPEHELSIYKYKYSFLTSIVATSTEAFVGLYKNSSGKFEAPLHFVFSSDGSEFKSIKKDIDRLIKSSVKVRLR